MPTDVLAAKMRRDEARKQETRDTTVVILLLSLSGAFFAIVRSLQSDAFELAVLTMSAVE